MKIGKDIVQRLINEQCPQYKELDIWMVEKSGHDNRTFHLGPDMIVRLPSGKDYALQAAKENKWLPYLSQQLSFAIPQPLYLGKPTQYYPYPWSILNYLEGETLTYQNITSLENFAKELRYFLNEFQKIDCSNGPVAGAHNFYRGGELKTYHQETLDALASLKDEQHSRTLEKLWNLALSFDYHKANVWVHGDIAPGNLLVKDGHLSAVIDFGILGTGDPACDYAMAWTFFDEISRQIFLADLSQDMIHRAMGWALWKALITYHDDKQSPHTIANICKDFADIL